MKKFIGLFIVLCLLNLFASVGTSGGGADQVDFPDIYIDESVAPGGVGSEVDPYSDFSEINWTTGGDNSVFDYYAGAEAASLTINLQMGEEWEEQMTVGESGSATYPIIIRSYGAGAKPIISGMREVTGWDTGGNWSNGGEVLEINQPDTDEHWTIRDNLCQKLDGPDFTVSKVSIYTDSGNAVTVHLEFWTDHSKAGAQIGDDSDDTVWSVLNWYDFTWSGVAPVLDGNDCYLHIETSGTSYWASHTDETKYVDTNYDLWRDGAEVGTDSDATFKIYSGGGAGTWSMDLATDPRRLLLDGTEYIEAETALDVDATYRWFYDTGATDLYVYATENPATDYSSMDYAASNVFCIWIDAKSYITVQDIELQGGEWALYIKNLSTNILVHDCAIGKYTWSQGIRIVGEVAGAKDQATDIEIYDSTIDMAYDSAGDDWDTGLNSDGIIFLDNVASSKLYGCTISDWTHASVEIECTVVDCQTEYLEIYDNVMDGANSNYDRGFDITNGDTTDQTAYIKIYRNYISNMTVRSQLNGNHNEFYYNIIDTVTEDLEPTYADGITLFGTNGVCHDNKIYNNVIYNVADHGIRIPDWGGENIQNNLVRNNIIMNWDMSSATKYGITIEADATVLGNTWENNLLYKAATADVAYYRGVARTIAEFNGEDGNNGDTIADNIGGDPLMVDPANGDFRLLMASPCINAGKDVSLTRDYRGRSIRHAPDIGAYEDPTNAVFMSAELLSFSDLWLLWNDKLTGLAWWEELGAYIKEKK